MALTVRYAPRAEKDLLWFDRDDRVRIIRRIKALAAADGKGFDARAIVGEPGLFRLREGDWRIMFERPGDEIHIRPVLHRREAYR